MNEGRTLSNRPVPLGPPSILRFSLVLFVVAAGLLVWILYTTRQAAGRVPSQPDRSFPGWREPPTK